LPSHLDTPPAETLPTSHVAPAEFSPPSNIDDTPHSHTAHPPAETSPTASPPSHVDASPNHVAHPPAETLATSHLAPAEFSPSHVAPSTSPASPSPAPHVDHSLPHPAPPQSPTIAPEPLPPILSRMLTRSQTKSLKPKHFPNFKLFHSTKHPFHSYHTILYEKEPTSFTKAATDSRWREAMLQEFQALVSNDTWTLCPRPLHHNIICY
jgi:hypothetical protein